MHDLNSILNDLKKIKPELSARFHVQSIGLFGSITRNDFTDKSDIDILVDFSKPIGIAFIDLADFLEHRYHCKVDLVSKGGMKQHFYEAIKKDVYYV